MFLIGQLKRSGLQVSLLACLTWSFFYVVSLISKLVLVCLKVSNWAWSPINQYLMYFQTTTSTLCMHQNLTKHGKSCIQNNQLPTEFSIELNDNSNVYLPKQVLMKHFNFVNKLQCNSYMHVFIAFKVFTTKVGLVSHLNNHNNPFMYLW